MKSFHTHTLVINCCIFFSDKWNHIECLCNISLFRQEFQCRNWLKLIKSWHKTSADLFDFYIENWEYSLYNLYCNQDSCSWILKHQSWNIVLMISRMNDVNSRAEIAYMSKSDLSREISHLDHTWYTSTVSEQQKHKRKSSCVNQQRDAKRARHVVAQSTHLIATALQSIQDEQKKLNDNKDFKTSWENFSLNAMLTRNNDFMSWAVKMRHDRCRVISTTNEKKASIFYSQNSDLSRLMILISKTYWRRIALQRQMTKSRRTEKSFNHWWEENAHLHR